MHRVRMSLPYFGHFGWHAEVVAVDEKYSEMLKDDLLLRSIPSNINIHYVGAFSKKWTSKLGLGSLALRSLWSYRKKVNKLLKQGHYDLIYFSTTAFPVCILGAYWEKKFGVPYVIDMQDPWHSDYYRDKPKDQRPPKYWFSYRLNKYLEPIAMKSVSGLISVSENYINDLKARYREIRNIPSQTITFGAFVPDLEVAESNKQLFAPLLDAQSINVVYIGRGGNDMHRSVSMLFEALKRGLKSEPKIFNKLKVYFIGTSYAPNGRGKPTIQPLARQFGIDNHIVEITNRISYYHVLATLQQADALFIPGSDDPKYTASKIYPYLLTEKPILAIFNSKSPAMNVLNDYGVKFAYTYDATSDLMIEVIDFLKKIVDGSLVRQIYNEAAIEKYSAENMTRLQCDLFGKIIGDTPVSE